MYLDTEKSYSIVSKFKGLGEHNLIKFCQLIQLKDFIVQYTVKNSIVIIAGDKSAVNPSHCGTKCAAHYVLTLDPGQEFTIKVRLYFQLEAPKTEVFGPDFDEIFQDRQKEADLFYDEV